MFEVKDQKGIRNHIEELLFRQESIDLEFKSAAGGFPKSFWETYSSFANTDGGIIILGVVEKNGTIFLDGLEDSIIEKYKHDFWNNVNNRATVSCNLMSDRDVVETNFNGYKFLLFHIPAATREQRPVYRGPQPLSGTYKRNNEGDYLCTEKEVQRMFADADTARPADCRILKNFSLDDIDKVSLRQYRQLFSIANPDHVWLALDDQELLRKLGGYRKDRTTGEEGFTVAGMLMFGKTDSITDPECVPSFFVDYQEQLSDDPNVRWTHRIYPDGTWEANLFQYYQKVLPALQSTLPRPFKLEGDTRMEESSAHIAVREAFVNLCIHADFSENASLSVKLKKNAFIFSNPGTLLVSKQQYYEGGESVCRNTSLQKMFMMLGKAEKAGSGVDKILCGWKDSNWRRPYILVKNRPDKVELYMPMEIILGEDVMKGLQTLYGKDFIRIERNKLITLALTYEEESINHDRLCYALDLHPSDISKMLRDLCSTGMLVSTGIGRGTRYSLPESFSPVKVATPIDPKVATPKGPKVATSRRSKVATSRRSKVATSKKIKKEDMFKKIQDFCSDWKSKEEISEHVERDVTYIRNKILPQMLELGYLQMQHPNVPNYPTQKYQCFNKIQDIEAVEMKLDFKQE